MVLAPDESPVLYAQSKQRQPDKGSTIQFPSARTVGGKKCVKTAFLLGD
jgi:hypothetical protein